MEINKAALIGLGAVGIMYGKQIIDTLGKDTLHVVADSGRIRRYQRDGIYANGSLCDFHYVNCDMPAEPVDLILFATKYTAFASAIRDSGNQIGPHTILLSALNGIVSEEDLAEAYGTDNLLYCSVQGMDATKTDNHVTYQNLGYFAIGEKNGENSEKLLAVKHFLESAGIVCKIPASILHHQWSKMMLNTGINQVTAVYETTYGGVAAHPKLYQLTKEAMREVQAVAACEGIRLTDQEIEDWLALTNSLSPEGTTSMRQDTIAHRQTEVDLFGGTTRRLGKKHGIPTPVNDMLYERIREIESSW